MVKESVKCVYNAYLCTTRKMMNKPFRPRKDFEGFEENVQFVQCSKLEEFFSKHPHIDMNEYFAAPFKIIDGFSPDLSFYNSLKAVRCYTNWQKMKVGEDIDGEEYLQKAKDSFSFILKFCLEEKIPVREYLHSSKVVPHWLIHLKNHQTIPYVLFGWDSFRREIENLPPDVTELFVSDLSEKYYAYKKKYNDSKKMRKFVEVAMKHLIIREAEAQLPPVHEPKQRTEKTHE